MRILIVDDEAGIRSFCERALRGDGHEVEVCESGEEAARRLGERWDLVVSDVSMPGSVDGHEVARLARTAGVGKVALMTAYPSVGSAVDAMRGGACDYLLKPFPLSALLGLARRAAAEAPAAPAPPIEPRRLREATILFADVRGFTAFSERVTPEEAASRLDDLLACFIEAVHAEGGTINKFIGDGAMAVFGLPLPHPDAAAAAARAALRARDAVVRRGELRFGFGINTGQVAAGRLGSSGSAEYGVIGAAVNLAARLRDCAAPGMILAGAEAASRLRGRFELGPERLLELKGLTAPAHAYEVFAPFKDFFRPR